MAYDYAIPDENNLVRTTSGDLALMQDNFEHLLPLASGLLADGSGGAARLLGLFLGDASKLNRFRVYWNGGYLKVSRNVGTLESPSWQDVLTVDEAAGQGSAAFAYVVSGQTPTAAAHLATKGYVDGKAYTLSGLTDAAVSGPTSGQVLEWNGSDWANVNHAHALAGLTDVVVLTPVSGESLVYNGSQWANELVSGGSGSATLSGLSDVAVSGAVSGEVLEFDGTDWRNAAFSAGTLSGLTDTAVSGAVSGDVLEFDGVQWSNKAFSAGTLSGLTDTAVSGAVSGEALIVAAALSGLSDVTITAPVSGAALQWNGATWVDAEPAASGVGLVESFDMAIGEVASGEAFTISLYAFYPYDVVTVRGKTSNGTCSLIFKIDGTPITGLSGIAISGTETGWDSSAAKAVAVGDTFSFEAADASSCLGLLLSIRTERT
jgi:hypothetical protein